MEGLGLDKTISNQNGVSSAGTENGIEKLNEHSNNTMDSEDKKPTRLKRNFGEISTDLSPTEKIERHQALLSKKLAVRERELREMLFLEMGGNLLEFDESSPALTAALESYHESHRLVSPKMSVTPKKEKRSPPPKSPSLSVRGPTLALRDSREDMAAKAAKDAEILKRVSELQKAGKWSAQRMPKASEPPRLKVHWDNLLAEMAWLANDFKEERKWKTALARKIARLVAKHHQDKENLASRQAKEEELHTRKLAREVSNEIKKFWAQIEKLVQYKGKLKADERKKLVLGKHLDFIVGQTERYSGLLAKDLVGLPGAPSPKPEKMEVEEKEPKKEIEEEKAEEEASMAMLLEKDGEEDKEEFAYHSDPDDETSVAREETEWQDDPDELSQLQREGELPIEELLARYSNMEAEEEEGESEEEEEALEGMEEGPVAPEGMEGSGESRLNAASSAAASAQPTGHTLATARVLTPRPFLLRGELREYQLIGLDWLVTMYNKRLNGILADEMGLGKTIQTIALLAYLASEKGLWGPHLIVVPTSLMLNWEVELKRWCPAFKILTYYGSLKERKQKRQGWSKPNAFHVCITSYKLVLQDQASFRRKKWHYLILDEAQHIKNFRSQRWQTLLNFNSAHRLLLTGTPLQNNLMELWSLMHFLMPHIFQSHKEFKDWFSNPVTSMIEGETGVNDGLIGRLHSILRPFLLRRLKSQVEQQLPSKHEHILRCRLSKRQRYLYEEFIQSASTQSTLSSGNFLGIANVLMQLRKVCNHPDLFESRPIISSFDQAPLSFSTSSLACKATVQDPLLCKDLRTLGLVCEPPWAMSQWELERAEELGKQVKWPPSSDAPPTPPSSLGFFAKVQNDLFHLRQEELRNRWSLWEEQQSQQKRWLVYDRLQLAHLRCSPPPAPPSEQATAIDSNNTLPGFTLQELAAQPWLREFVVCIPPVRSPPLGMHASHASPPSLPSSWDLSPDEMASIHQTQEVLRPLSVRMQLHFPDRRLIQWDCGKLQALDQLLRELRAGGHRALIFTQMTRMLDILEEFLNLYGYTYVRLDGSTKVETRQNLMDRFNRDSRIFLFILSTRSGGIGVNLTGADTVIFYDSDWNPAMDAQAQDRCHRIGQTREVHIYRLVSEHTVEENILRKARQKRHLDNLVITGGGFTTDWFRNLDVRELFGTGSGVAGPSGTDQRMSQELENALAAAEEPADLLALKEAQKEAATELTDFSEEPLPESREIEEPKSDLTPFESELTPIQR